MSDDNEFESTQSVETQEQASSEPEVSTNEVETSEAEGQEAQAAEKPAPFHEHPRFKEVISQNTQYKTQLTQYETMLRDMQTRLQQLESGSKQAAKPEAELFDRLKKIDPSFGNKFEEVATTAQEIREIKAWREEMENQRIRDQYSSGLEKLCNDSKVSPAWKSVYDAEIRAIAMSNPNLGLQDLPRVFKEVHDKFEAIRREERAQYVSAKAKDAKTPASQAKGKTPSSTKKEPLPMDRDEALGSIVQQALKMHRSSNDF